MDTSVGSGGPKLVIGTGMNGVTQRMTSGDETDVSAVFMQFVPDGSWSGSITIVSRSQTPDAATDAVDFTSSPFRKLYLNGAAGDGSLVVGGTAITGASKVLVPSAGQIIALSVTCSAGAMTVYTTPLIGPSVL